MARNYLLQSHESSSNPLTSTHSNPSHHFIKTSKFHALNFSKHVQESRYLPQYEIPSYQTIPNGQFHVQILIHREDTLPYCLPIFCTYHRRPRPVQLPSILGKLIPKVGVSIFLHFALQTIVFPL